ncbi:MAG: glycosyltransferase family 4 protein [Candidatus Omnitrophica bacterium]|nr:glycosyltransferase family 4 protein [Candidatus Omnitrophota bacterium]
MNTRISKIRILYLHNMTQISGGEQSLLNLWAKLDRQRFEPFLIIPEEGDLSRAAKILGVPVAFLDVPPLHSENWRQILQTALLLRKYLRLNRIDLIHSYSPRNNILSALVARFLGLPVIWHERNLIFGDEPDRSRQFFYLPSRIICNSQAVSKRFEGVNGFNQKVRVILNGVDLEEFKPLDANLKIQNKFGLVDKKVVGMVSNLNARKRIEFLIETAPLVVEKMPDVKFLIIGGEFPDERGWRLKELKAQAKRAGVLDHIVFANFQDDVCPFLNVLDLVVHVTPKEACSRAILEAMSCAKPVVAMNDGGNPELVKDGHTGVLVTLDDKEVLAETIINLLCDDSRRLMMGQQGRQRVEQLFDVKRNAQETQKVYLECVSSSISS